MAAKMNIQPGMRVLDIGCGSGILALGAAKLGAAPVMAIDNDPIAVETAQANVAANGAADHSLVEGLDHEDPHHEAIESAEALEGADFAELAKVHSTDTGSGADGGNLGWLVHADCAPEFAKELFGHKEIGVLPRLVHSRFGLHVVEILQREAGVEQPFEVEPVDINYMIERFQIPGASVSGR